AKYAFKAHYVAPDTDNEWSLSAPSGFAPQPGLAVAGLDALLSASAQVGVRVLLTGEVADSAVRGSPLVFDSLVRRGRMLEAARRLRRYLGESDERVRTVLALYLVAPLLPLSLQRVLMGASAERYVRKNAWRLLPDWISESLDGELRGRHREVLLHREQRRRFSNPTLHWEHQALYPAEQAPLPGGWPVEFRRPFADPRLHAFLLAIPPEEKFKPHPTVAGSYAGGKHLLREAMREILPEPIRSKTAITAFNFAVSQEIDRHWPRYVQAFGPHAHPRVAERGYVDHGRFWKRLQSFREGGTAAKRADARLVMYVIGLEQWLHGLELPRSVAVNVATRWKAPGSSIRAEARVPGISKLSVGEEQPAAPRPLLRVEVNV
ncbi:MAG TPA: asparagine synthase-related protein, partial [Chloroflexota bacterium]